MKGLVLTFGNSRNGVFIPLPENPNVLDALIDWAQPVHIERNWDGNIKSVKRLNEKITYTLVLSRNFVEPDLDPEVQLAVLQKHKKDYEDSLAQINKEIENLATR